MYKNTTYKLDIVRKDLGENQLTNYEDMAGAYASPLYFNEGERGWFVFETPYGASSDTDKWHRVVTSKVILLENSGGNLTVETENTYYYFTKELR